MASKNPSTCIVTGRNDSKYSRQVSNVERRTSLPENGCAGTSRLRCVITTSGCGNVQDNEESGTHNHPHQVSVRTASPTESPRDNVQLPRQSRQRAIASATHGPTVVTSTQINVQSGIHYTFLTSYHAFNRCDGRGSETKQALLNWSRSQKRLTSFPQQLHEMFDE